MQLDLLNGLTIGPSGPDHAPANHSAPPASARVKTTNATSGQPFLISSASAALSESLASRCRELLASVGSMEYRQTWKRKATPAGRSYWAHTASGRRTSDSGFTGWPTPNAGPQNDGDTTWQQRREALKEKHGNGNGFGMTLGQAVTLTGWPTPVVNDSTGSQYAYGSGDHSKIFLKLPGAAMLTGWPTPMAGTPAQNGNNEAGNNDSSRKTVALVSGWATPAARDWRSENATDEFNQARWKHTRGKPLLAEATLASGAAPNTSNAATEKRGALNPAFSLWLMGYNHLWIVYSPFKTQARQK